MSAPATIVCFGIAVADRVYEVDALPSGEGKRTATGYRDTGGGIAATASVAIAALGGHAVFAGTVGDDPAGHFIQAELIRLGVDCTALTVTPGARTPSACVMVDPSGERCAVVDRGTVASCAPDPNRFADLKAVLVDHRFPEEAAKLLRALPPTIPGILDGEGGGRPALQVLTEAASHPVFSRNGLRELTGLDDPLSGLWSVVAPRAAAIGVTLGASGSLWRIGQSIHDIPVPAVCVRDTTGCGDVFHGAFALALGEGCPVLEAAHFASAAAAIKARNGNGWLGMAKRESASALLSGLTDPQIAG